MAVGRGSKLAGVLTVGGLTGAGYLLVLVMLLLPHGSVGAQNEVNDIQAFLTALDSTHGEESVDSKVGSWGIPDAVATVGKIFKYQLPRDKDQAIGTFKVSEVGGTGLPAWLSLDAVTGTLLGVPDAEHAGRHHYLEVIAVEPVAESALGSRPRDMFTLHVGAEESPHAAPGQAVPYGAGDADGDELHTIKCPSGSSVTTAAIILDVELEKMLPQEKAGMMEKMCGHLQMPAEMLRVAPAGHRSMFDSSALVAGPGDVKAPEHSGAVLQWEVGCGNVHANQMPMLQTLEATAGNGSMALSVGHGVIGWHVTNNKLQQQAHTRLKRQVRVQATPTLLPSVGAPTRQPVPTRVIPDSGPSAGPDSPPSSSKHKHKHRTKTKGRHPHHKTPKHSPKHTATAMPAPSALPIQPTSVVKVMPTTDAVTPQMPPAPVPSPGAATTVGIQPSMTPPLPGGVTTSTPTEILPTRPTQAPGVISTEPIRPTATEASTTATKTPVLVPTEPFNYPPILKNNIQRLTVEVGEVFDYKIPKDTFNDFEDGNTRNLKLVFLSVDGMSVSRVSWVKLNVEQQRLYGMPLPEHEGRHDYLLAAIDTAGSIARDPFEIDVQRRPRERAVNHELSVVLDMDYGSFIVDVDKRMDVAGKVASVFGDRDASRMTVTRISNGSVIYAWANITLPLKPCPTRDIAHLVSFLLTEDNTLQPAAVESMKPYRLLKAGAERKGECAKDDGDGDDNGVWSKSGGGGGGDGDTKEVASKPHETSDDDVLLTTVVPAVIIAAMLLLAALIACILYRKKRKGKLSDEDQHTFINKGIPIIFADELEEKPDPSGKPLIMADEKPPLPPPEYPRGSSVPSTPGSNHKEPLLMDSGDDDLASTPYQPPPPPLTGSMGSRGSTGRRAGASSPPYSRQPYVQP